MFRTSQHSYDYDFPVIIAKDLPILQFPSNSSLYISVIRRCTSKEYDFLPTSICHWQKHSACRLAESLTTLDLQVNPEK